MSGREGGGREEVSSPFHGWTPVNSFFFLKKNTPPDMGGHPTWAADEGGEQLSPQPHTWGAYKSFCPPPPKKKEILKGPLVCFPSNWFAPLKYTAGGNQASQKIGTPQLPRGPADSGDIANWFASPPPPHTHTRKYLPPPLPSDAQGKLRNGHRLW